MKQQQITKETKIYKELDWLKSQKDYISIYKIERELEMPEGTLKKFVDGNRRLPEKWHEPVMVWVRAFKK